MAAHKMGETDLSRGIDARRGAKIPVLGKQILCMRQSLSGSLETLVSRNVLAIPVGLYLALWLPFSLWHSVPFASIETDGMEYIKTAQTLFSRNFSFSSFHGIGYPSAIWLSHLLVPDWFAAARLVSGAAGLFFVWATFQLIRLLFEGRAAFIGTLLVVTNFFVIANSGMAMADMLGASLGLLALLVLLRWSHAARYAVAGILVGFAVITRYQYAGLVFASALIWVLEPTNLTRLRAVTLYAGVFVIALLPLLFANWSVFGDPLLNANFKNLGPWFYSSPQSSSVQSWQAAVDLILRDPRYFASGYLRALFFDLPLYLFHIVFYSMFFTLAGWALILLRGVELRRTFVLLSFAGLYGIVTGLSWVTQARFWLFAIPFIAIGCSFLIVRLSENRSLMGSALLSLLLVANGLGAMANLPHLVQEQAPEFQRAGRVIRNEAQTNARVLVSQPQIAYFAERSAVIFRDVPQTWNDLPEAIAQRGIDYVVMDDRYGTAHYPEFDRLFDTALVLEQFPQWRLVYSEGNSPRIVVYHVSAQ